MPQIKIGDILGTLRNLGIAAFGHRNDPTYWEAEMVAEDRDDDGKQDKRKLKVTAASVEPTTIELTFQDGEAGTPFTIEARPKGKNSAVFYNGDFDPEAHVVYKPVWGNIVGRFHLDFRPVTVDGKEVRINTAFPTHN